MNREFTSNGLPAHLVEHLQANEGLLRFRRRAVLTLDNGKWSLICCTIEGFVPGENCSEHVPSRRYRTALLLEDWLTAAQCTSLAMELLEGRGNFGDVSLSLNENASWTAERVSIGNDYMSRAGSVVSLNLGGHGMPAQVGALIDPEHPYYPDWQDAARDWLPFRKYHGQSDGRNHQIIFMLPETRAFISRAEMSERGSLIVSLSGTEVSTKSLLIKGAYWEDGQIHHLHAAVNEASAELLVPGDVDRLEYCLIDSTGTVFDFHREDRLSRIQHGESVLGSAKRSLANQVRQAVKEGEGSKIEFKPFVNPRDKLGTPKQKTKLQEVINTVVAFANTEGGSIFLGIDDDCSLAGVDERFREWAQADINDTTLTRYCGELKSRIKDVVLGDVSLTVSSLEIDDVNLVVIDVLPSASKPLSVQQDLYLYARKGATNRKVPPGEWQSVITERNNWM